MATVEKMIQLFEMINKAKVIKHVTKDNYEDVILKDEHNNKFEIKFYPDFYKEDK